MKVGKKTDTYDITGKVLEEKEVTLNKEHLINTLNSFVGEYEQTVPIYSSVKVNGKNYKISVREARALKKAFGE